MPNEEAAKRVVNLLVWLVLVMAGAIYIGVHANDPIEESDSVKTARMYCEVYQRNHVSTAGMYCPP